MNNPPLISIIIPCYNSEATIGKCLESVIHQDYGNIEIVVIDDGSTDKTSGIVNTFREKNSRIVIVHQQNSGVSKARNVGIKTASGEYICFVDSDDWVEKNYCSVLLEHLIKNNSDISIVQPFHEQLFTDDTITESDTEEKVEIISGEKGLELLLEDKEIQSHPWGKLFRKNLFDNINFPEHLQAFEDYFTLFKVFDKAEKIVISNKKLYHYIEFPDSLSHNLTPERAFHFFQAILESHHYVSERNFPNRKHIIRNMLKKILMVMKRIIRKTEVGEFVSEKKFMREQLKDFLSYSLGYIGIEYYLYLRLWIYYPDLYTRIVKK